MSTTGKADRTDGARLMAKLEEGVVLCAEGYIFELERRGYVQAGPFTPNVVLDEPAAVRQLTHEYCRAGSDVVEALTYYAHREKLSVVGGEASLERLNRAALRIAADVAAEHGDLLVAGNVSNTNTWRTDDAERRAKIRAMFDEQVALAKAANVDFIIGETFDYAGEALEALASIKAAGMRAVITLAVHRNGTMLDGATPAAACKQLADAGADVVGLNCARGPATMLPLLGDVVKAVAPTPVAALPVMYVTNDAIPTMQTLKARDGVSRAFPVDLEPHVCTRAEAADFTRKAVALGVRYVGPCCGGSPHHVRSMAEALGRSPAASKYSPNLAMHVHFGDANKSKIDAAYAKTVLDINTKDDATATAAAAAAAE